MIRHCAAFEDDQSESSNSPQNSNNVKDSSVSTVHIEQKNDSDDEMVSSGRGIEGEAEIRNNRLIHVSFFFHNQSI